MNLLLLQNNPSPNTSIDGALVLVLLAIGSGIPLILNGVIIPSGKALVNRINTGTDRQIENLEVFKLLKEEVKRLNEEHKEDQITISKMQGQILELQQKQFVSNQTINEKDAEIIRLQSALQDCIRDKMDLIKEA